MVHRRWITAASGIPDDLLMSEILVRLPAVSLARCRCVCRSWRAEIAAAAFVRRHRELSRARPPSVLAIPLEIDPPHPDGRVSSSLSSSSSPSSPPPGDIIGFHRLLLPPPARAGQPPAGGGSTAETKLIFEKAWPREAEAGVSIARAISPKHCDGLVAIATATDTVFVCNPATREFVALPPGSHSAELDYLSDSGELLRVPPVALGFDQWRNSYVVARYFYLVYGEVSRDEATGDVTENYAIGHEVFALGGGGGGGDSGPGEWERTQDPPCLVGVQGPICTRRAFYWHSEVPEPRLVRFGLQDRAFDVVPRPPVGWNSLDNMTDLDGKLCYVHVLVAAEAAAAPSFLVWMADDDGTPAGEELRWSLRHHIELTDPVPGVSYHYQFLPVATTDGDTVVAIILSRMLCRFNKQLQDDSADETLELLQVQSPHSVLYVLPYIETLVSIEARNY